jgi:hypothetical protein
VREKAGEVDPVVEESLPDFEVAISGQERAAASNFVPTTGTERYFPTK